VAAQILLELLSGGSPESRVKLPGKLIVRQSTAALGSTQQDSRSLPDKQGTAGNKEEQENLS